MNHAEAEIYEHVASVIIKLHFLCIDGVGFELTFHTTFTIFALHIA